MGLDLTLCPIQYNVYNSWLAYNRLELCRDYRLFSNFANIYRAEVKPVVNPVELHSDVTFRWYSDGGLEKRGNDPYGTPLTYVLARDFCKVNTTGLNEWNRAVIEFIQSLPGDTPIVLWWS